MIFSLARASIVTLVLISLSACSVVERRFGSGSARAEFDSRSGALHYTKVKLQRNCIAKRVRGLPDEIEDDPRFAQILLPIISAVGPSLVKSGVGLFTSRLKERATPTTERETSLTAGQFYQSVDKNGNATPKNYCIMVARAAYGGSLNKDGLEKWAAKIGEALGYPVGWTEFVDEFRFSEPPDLYAEFHIEYSNTPAVFEVKPVLLNYNRPLSELNRTRGRNFVSFVFYFNGVYAGDQNERPVFADVIFPVMAVRTNSTLGPEALSGVTSGWHALPISESLTTPAGEKVPSPVPINLVATVIETDDPTVLSEILAASADDINRSLSKELSGALNEFLDKRAEKETDDSY